MPIKLFVLTEKSSDSLIRNISFTKKMSGIFKTEQSVENQKSGSVDKFVAAKIADIFLCAHFTNTTLLFSDLF